MKKIFLLIMLFAFGYQAHSQVLITLLLGDKLNSDKLEFGLEGGYNWATLSGMDAKRPLSTINLGFYFDIQLKKQLRLYTGVLVKSKLGIDNLSANDLTLLQSTTYDEEGTYSQQLNYFLVPILAKYNFKSNMYFELGPQAGLLHKAWVEYNSKIDDKEATVKEYNRDDINRIDFGLMAGIGYKMFQGTGWSFGVKYYYGLVDVYKNRSNTKNSSLFLKVSIPIGAGKKPESKKKK